MSRHRNLRLVVTCLLVVFGMETVIAAEEPPRRLLPCPTDSDAAVNAWQQRARATLFALMKIDDLVVQNAKRDDAGPGFPLKVSVAATERHEKYFRKQLEIDAHPNRRIKVILTIPVNAKPGSTPAVVCIHGHGGNRQIVYDTTTVYHGFAQDLAEHGYVTLSTDVGQHDVGDPYRTLMGERLWDVIRLVDLAVAQPEVDPNRIGCAGLSLGGEMAMWLGAMDTRIAATVSSGFLTTMENLREGHCMCWDFPGLQRRYDFADIYSLISPRPLQCQNGRLERLPIGFPVDLAEQAFVEIFAVYEAQHHGAAVSLDVHPGGHEFDVAAANEFFAQTLTAQEPASSTDGTDSQNPRD
jgi:hypothetical protein